MVTVLAASGSSTAGNSRPSMTYAGRGARRRRSRASRVCPRAAKTTMPAKTRAERCDRKSTRAPSASHHAVWPVQTPVTTSGGTREIARATPGRTAATSLRDSATAPSKPVARAAIRWPRRKPSRRGAFRVCGTADRDGIGSAASLAPEGSGLVVVRGCSRDPDGRRQTPVHSVAQKAFEPYVPTSTGSRPAFRTPGRPGSARYADRALTDGPLRTVRDPVPPALPPPESPGTCGRRDPHRIHEATVNTLWK